MPLYHFVANDLPANTRASELDDQNAAASLLADAAWTGVDLSSGSAVTIDMIGKYLKYLCVTGYLKPPPGRGVPLPQIELAGGQKAAQEHMGGRGGVL